MKESFQGYVLIPLQETVLGCHPNHVLGNFSRCVVVFVVGNSLGCISILVIGNFSRIVCLFFLQETFLRCVPIVVIIFF